MIGEHIIRMESLFHLSAKREVGRLERRLLLRDREWSEFTLANIDPLSALRNQNQLLFNYYYIAILANIDPISALRNQNQ